MSRAAIWRWPALAGMAVALAGSAFAGDGLQDAVAAYQAGKLAEAKAMFEQVAAKDPKNRAAQNYLHQIDTKMAGGLAMKRKIDAILVSKVDLRDASAHEAFEFIFQMLNRNAPQGFHPNMVWAVPGNEQKNITLALENVPGSTALEYAAKLAGVRVSYEEFAVRILPE